MKIAISGSTGLLGERLVSALTEDGHEVVRMVRRPAQPGEIQWAPGGHLPPERLAGIAAVVHLAGEPIGAKRWTDEQRQRILASRRDGTRTVAQAVAEARDGPSVLVSASAVGYYGDCGDELLTEESAPGDDFLADVVAQWEAAADPAREAGVRVAHPRSGVVLDPGGGALGRMLPLFKFGLGGRFGSGGQWWPWVTIDDEVRALRFALEGDLSGPFNVAAPTPVTNAEFSKTLAAVLHRPAFLPVPRFGPKLVFGEMADALLFGSQRVVPARLVGAGFDFAWPELEPALRHLLKRGS